MAFNFVLMLLPFNFQRWLEEHRHELVPPVGNKNLSPDSEDYIVMVVAGPNARKDYHYNETDEFFFQLEGRITVRTQVDGRVVDHTPRSRGYVPLPCQNAALSHPRSRKHWIGD